MKYPNTFLNSINLIFFPNYFVRINTVSPTVYDPDSQQLGSYDQNAHIMD